MQAAFINKIKYIYQDFPKIPQPLQVGIATLACLLLGGISLLYACYRKGGQTTDPQKKRWTITFTPEALTVGVDQKIKTVYNSDNILNYSKIDSLTKEAQAVAWDQGKVTKVREEKKPYTKNMSTCLGIAARGYKEGSARPDYLALHHISTNPIYFEKTLLELVQKVQKGTIEIFITGGDSSSKKNYTEALRIIEKCKTDSCDIVILDDTYNVAAQNGDFFVITKTLMCPFSAPGIGIVGFDDELNPVQSIAVSDSADVLSPSKMKTDPIEKITWSQPRSS